MSDLRVWECSSRCVNGMHAEHEYNREPTDADLIGELVRRGVLVKSPYGKDWIRLYGEYRTVGEPVGSVGETP